MTPSEQKTLERLEGICRECLDILANNPGSLSALRRLGYAQWILGDYDGVEDTATQILSQNPTDTNWLYSRAMARIAKGQLYEAENDLICARGISTDERMTAVIAEALGTVDRLKDEGGEVNGN
jgi:tetratricopeptide (TPR) repeat protein